MKILFDENLSRTLSIRPADLFPDSKSVFDVSLGEAPDPQVLTYARANGFVVATKDSGYGRMAMDVSGPPKIIWVRAGNCSTARVEELFRRYAIKLAAFEQSSAPVLVLA